MGTTPMTIGGNRAGAVALATSMHDWKTRDRVRKIMAIIREAETDNLVREDGSPWTTFWADQVRTFGDALERSAAKNLETADAYLAEHPDVVMAESEVLAEVALQVQILWLRALEAQAEKRERLG
jgi:hypothetical protein